jgi:hypothetical protein
MKTDLFKILKEEKERILLLHQNQGYGGKKLIREYADDNGNTYFEANYQKLIQYNFPPCIAKYSPGVYWKDNKPQNGFPKASFKFDGKVYFFYNNWRAYVKDTNNTVDYYCLSDTQPRIGRPTIDMMKKTPQIKWKYSLQQLEAASKSCPTGQVYDETVGKCTLQAQEVTASATGQAATGQAATGQAATGQAATGQAATTQPSNNNVTSVQTALNSAGFSVGQKGADGRMGADTLTAINQLIAKYT